MTAGLFDRKWEVSKLLHKDFCTLHILRSRLSGRLKQQLDSLTLFHFHNFIASICQVSISGSIATSHQNTTAFTSWNQVNDASRISNSMNFIRIVENEQQFQFVLVFEPRLHLPRNKRTFESFAKYRSAEGC